MESKWGKAKGIRRWILLESGFVNLFDQFLVLLGEAKNDIWMFLEQVVLFPNIFG